MHNYGDSGPSGLGPVSVTMHHAFGYALKGVSVMSLCSFRASVGSVFIVVGVVTDTLEQVNACNAERGTVWTVRPRATVKKLPSMPGDSYASVMWGQCCRYRYILPHNFGSGYFRAIFTRRLPHLCINFVSAGKGMGNSIRNKI
ncbi:MAG: hypothetical protein K2K23_06720 [Muribaculaceae bacterium]|nr:hypothetical protein [Muribaculaceae bacterium]